MLHSAPTELSPRRKRFKNFFALPLMLLTVTLAIGLFITGIVLTSTGIFSPVGLTFGALGAAVGLSLPTTGAFVIILDIGVSLAIGISTIFALPMLVGLPVSWLFNKYDDHKTQKEQIVQTGLEEKNNDAPFSGTNYSISFQEILYPPQSTAKCLDPLYDVGKEGEQQYIYATEANISLKTPHERGLVSR